MSKTVKEVMLPLSEYAVVDEDATILDALVALEKSQDRLPSGRQPHRGVLIRNDRGEIVGKLQHFAFLRAFLPERKPLAEMDFLERAGVSDELLASSMQTLDFLTGDQVDLCERARSVLVRDVCTPPTQGVTEDTSLADAAHAFLVHQTLSILVRRAGVTVGILRLSDLFDELARQIMHNECQ